MPEMRYLATFAAISGGEGTSSIAMYNLLPNGGIDGRHLCGIVSEVPFRGSKSLAAAPTAAGTIWGRQALQLSHGVDYARQYRRLYDDILASGQLRVAPSGVYTVWGFPEGSVPSPGDAAFELVIAQAGRCADTAIIAGSTVLVPDC
jgi:hypothetical protein